MPISASLRTALAVVTATGAAIAADAEPFLQLQVPDMSATKERFVNTPYASLVETVWGKDLLSKAEALMTARDPRLIPTMNGFGGLSLAMAMQPPPAEPQFMTWITAADVQTTGEVMAGLMPGVEADAEAWTLFGEPFMRIEDGNLVIAPGESQLQAPALTDIDTSDVAFRVSYANLVDAFAGLDELDADMAMPKQMRHFNVEIRTTMDPIGMRERMSGSAGPELKGMFQAWAELPADRAELAKLSASTLWAMTSRTSRDAMSDWWVHPMMVQMQQEGAFREMDAMLAAVGLPDYQTLSLSLDGPMTIWCEQGVPFPSVSASIAIDADAANRILASIADHSDLALGEDGRLSGVLGVVSFMGAYVDGRLLMTTKPGGVDFLSNDGGFLDHPAAAIGLSRSGDWWGGLADLGAMFAAQAPITGLAGAGNDLRKAGSYGFMWYRADQDDGFEMESGGLFGGMMTMTMVTSMAAGFSVPFVMNARGGARALQVEEMDEGDAF
jgi:hypothetical protein